MIEFWYGVFVGLLSVCLAACAIIVIESWRHGWRPNFILRWKFQANMSKYSKAAPDLQQNAAEVRDMKLTVFDMGAHMGEDTEYFLRRGYRVVAFECNPELVASLAETFAGAIREGDLILVDKAIARTAGKVSFYAHANSVWGTTSADWSERNQKFLNSAVTQTVEVNSITPNECFAKYGIPHYLKVDVEGMDHAILEALLWFKSRPAYISIESEKVHWKVMLREFEVFEQLGYTRFNIVDQRWNRFKTTTWTDAASNTLTYRHRRHSSGPACNDLKRGWCGRRLALAKYRLIFLNYRLFGDSSPLRKIPLVGKLFAFLGGSWYDTHARL